ncbi:MAG: riboflavin kinase, partial [Phycisphaerae bacterium]|nr:riboflavin kinase [Phycisphaerae bacterium]
TVEAHLLDFTGDLVGQPVELDVVARLRGIEKFESVAKLTEQVGRDVAEVQKRLIR